MDFLFKITSFSDNDASKANTLRGRQLNTLAIKLLANSTCLYTNLLRVNKETLQFCNLNVSQATIRSTSTQKSYFLQAFSLNRNNLRTGSILRLGGKYYLVFPTMVYGCICDGIPFVDTQDVVIVPLFKIEAAYSNIPLIKAFIDRKFDMHELDFIQQGKANLKQLIYGVVDKTVLEKHTRWKGLKKLVEEIDKSNALNSIKEEKLKSPLNPDILDVTYMSDTKLLELYK